MAWYHNAGLRLLCGARHGLPHEQGSVLPSADRSPNHTLLFCGNVIASVSRSQPQKSSQVSSAPSHQLQAHCSVLSVTFNRSQNNMKLFKHKNARKLPAASALESATIAGSGSTGVIASASYSGLHFVDNSQGASKAVKELSNTLDESLNDIEVYGDSSCHR